MRKNISARPTRVLSKPDGIQGTYELHLVLTWLEGLTDWDLISFQERVEGDPQAVATELLAIVRNNSNHFTSSEYASISSHLEQALNALR